MLASPLRMCQRGKHHESSNGNLLCPLRFSLAPLCRVAPKSATLGPSVDPIDLTPRYRLHLRPPPPPSLSSYCHVEDRRVIPHRVVHHWDFATHRVCKDSGRFLDATRFLPVFDLPELSPSLFAEFQVCRCVVCSGLPGREGDLFPLAVLAEQRLLFGFCVCARAWFSEPPSAHRFEKR